MKKSAGSASPKMSFAQDPAWGIRADDRQLLEKATNYNDSLFLSGTLIPLIQQWIPYCQP
jgi:hypothetical protein